VRHFAVAGTALESRHRRFATTVNMIGVTGGGEAFAALDAAAPRLRPWRVGSGGRLSRRIG